MAARICIYGSQNRIMLAYIRLPSYYTARAVVTLPFVATPSFEYNKHVVKKGKQKKQPYLILVAFFVFLKICAPHAQLHEPLSGLLGSCSVMFVSYLSFFSGA
jgi:hypothetical protein